MRLRLAAASRKSWEAWIAKHGEKRMRIAVATFDERVSPRFDCAAHFLLVESDGQRTTRREQFALPPAWDAKGILQRLDWLADQGVTDLICGGIDGCTAGELRARGIRLFDWVSGEVDDALAAWLRGELEPRMMMGRGGRCRGHWRPRGGRGGGRRAMGSGRGMGGGGRGLGGGGGRGGGSGRGMGGGGRGMRGGGGDGR